MDVFHVFNVFLYPRRFLLKKTFIENFINNLRRTFRSTETKNGGGLLTYFCDT